MYKMRGHIMSLWLCCIANCGMGGAHCCIRDNDNDDQQQLLSVIIFCCCCCVVSSVVLSLSVVVVVSCLPSCCGPLFIIMLCPPSYCVIVSWLPPCWHLSQLLICIAWGWTWKCAKCKTRIKCLGKNPKTPDTHSLTHTHTITIWYKSSGPLILKNITCVLKSLNSIVLIQVLMYLIANHSPKTLKII